MGMKHSAYYSHYCEVGRGSIEVLLSKGVCLVLDFFCICKKVSSSFKSTQDVHVLVFGNGAAKSDEN